MSDSSQDYTEEERNELERHLRGAGLDLDSWSGHPWTVLYVRTDQLRALVERVRREERQKNRVNLEAEAAYIKAARDDAGETLLIVKRAWLADVRKVATWVAEHRSYPRAELELSAERILDGMPEVNP